MEDHYHNDRLLEAKEELVEVACHNHFYVAEEAVGMALAEGVDGGAAVEVDHRNHW